jgi:SAM-dependent methyltransferase
LNRRRLEFLTQRLVGLNLSKGSAVLEIGAGTGWLLHRLAERFPWCTFTGVEPDPTYVGFANRRPPADNEHYVVATGEDLSSLDGRYDVILTNDVLHHVASLEKTISSAATVAHDRCTWWAIEPNMLNPYTLLRQQFTAGERNFVPRTALRIGRAHGWRAARQRYLFLIPPFIKAPATWMVAAERRFEGLPPVAGGVCIEWARGTSARQRPGQAFSQ